MAVRAREGTEQRWPTAHQNTPIRISDRAKRTTASRYCHASVTSDNRSVRSLTLETATTPTLHSTRAFLFWALSWRPLPAVTGTTFLRSAPEKQQAPRAGPIGTLRTLQNDPSGDGLRLLSPFSAAQSPGPGHRLVEQKPAHEQTGYENQEETDDDVLHCYTAHNTKSGRPARTFVAV